MAGTRLCLVGKIAPICGGVAGLSDVVTLELQRAGYDVVRLSDQHAYDPLRQQLIDVRMRRHAEVDISSNLQCSFGRNTDEYVAQLVEAGLKHSPSLGCDLLVGWYINPYWPVAAAIARRLRVPLALIHAGSDLAALVESSKMRAMARSAIEASSAIITACPDVFEHLYPASGCQKLPIRHIEYGTRLPSFFGVTGRTLQQLLRCSVEELSKDRLRPVPLKEAFIRRCGKFSRPKHVVLTVGKVSPGKNLDVVVGAVAQLRREGLDIGLVQIVGGEVGPVQELLAMLDCYPELDRSAAIIPFMSRECVAEFMSVADMGVCMEAGFRVRNHFSIVAHEMMRSGLPLVVSREQACGPFYRDVLLSDLNCILVDPSVPSLSAGIRSIAGDEKRRRELSELALTSTTFVEKTIPALGGVASSIISWCESEGFPAASLG